ncbi:MAG: GxxExxY protein [Verrucomicrobiales bacterium]
MNHPPFVQDLKKLTYEIIGASMTVHNELGPGLREKPYENALVLELRDQGFRVEQQRAFPILYKNRVVGDCIPDIVVNSLVIVDVKSIDTVGDTEAAQMLNYLRIAQLKIGLVINFRNPKIEVKRLSK